MRPTHATDKIVREDGIALSVVDHTDCRLPFGGCALCNPEQEQPRVTRTAHPQRLDPDTIDQLRQLEVLRMKQARLQEKITYLNEYLRDALEEAGYTAQDLVSDAVTRAKLQPSFQLERLPDAPQAALDAVFQRVPYVYVRVWTELVPARRPRAAAKTALPRRRR